MRRPRRNLRVSSSVSTASSVDNTVDHAADHAVNNNNDGGNLGNDLMTLIANFLPTLLDLYAFSSVCRYWRSLLRPCPASAALYAGRPPMLLYPTVGSKPRSCHIIDPSRGDKVYRSLVSSQTLGRSVVGYSYGNLIFNRRAGRFIVLADVFTGAEIYTASFPKPMQIDFGALTAPISSPDCFVLIHSGSTLFSCQIDDDTWKEYSLDRADLKLRQIVVFGDQIYALNHDGRLFIIEFSPKFSMKLFIGCRNPNDDNDDEDEVILYENRLVKCGDDLLLVFYTFTKVLLWRMNFEIYRLDISVRSRPEWVRVRDIGDWSLFISHSSWSTYAWPSPSKWGGSRNRIYYTAPHVGHLKWQEFSLSEYNEPLIFTNYARHRYSDHPTPLWVYPSSVSTL